MVKSMSSLTWHGNRSASGFTLIELLSAMVLMSLIMALATMSLSQFSQYRDISGLGFEARINRYLSLERMAGLIEKTTDYYVKDTLGKVRPYFIGDKEGIKFVSTTSWVQDERASLNYLVVEENADSLKALVLYQKNLVEDVFFEVSQFPQKETLSAVLLLEGASRITIEYLGIDNIRQLYPSGTTDYFPSKLKWNYRFDSSGTGYLPDKVKINVEWPDGTVWPCIVDIKSLNYSKRSLMLDGNT